MQKYTVVLLLNVYGPNPYCHYALVEAENQYRAEDLAYTEAYLQERDVKKWSNRTFAIYKGHQRNLIG